MQNIIIKHVLANQLKYGKADVKSVVAKILGEMPEAKKRAKQVVEDVKKAVKEYENLAKNEIESLLEGIAPEMLEKKAKVAERKELPELEGAETGKVRLRLPPEPNGYLHIGHGLSFTMNYMYAKKYGGKLVLKLEDNNPATTRPHFYGEIQKDIRWLGIEWDELFILSEHLGELEGAAEKLIRAGKAYVCRCPADKIKKGRMHKEADACRGNSRAENLELWSAMKSGEKLVLRWKGDPASDNSVLRDPTLYRVIDQVHPWIEENRMVYPTYDLASSATDGMLAITHVLRSEEFLMRAPLHREIIQSLGHAPPFYVHFGRFNLEGAPTSKRLIRSLVESKKVIGWDDPRLATLMGLRRRGIVPETFADLVLATGPYKGSSTIDRKLLEGYNRKHLDPVAERYFVLKDAVKLRLEGPKDAVARISKLPGNDEAGFRELKPAGHIWIEKSDFEQNKGGVLRLKGLYNIRLEGRKAVHAEGEPVRPIIHWLGEYIEGSLMMMEPEKNRELNEKLKTIKVMAEPGIVNAGSDIIQMERFGFAHIENRKPLKMIFVSK